MSPHAIRTLLLISRTSDAGGRWHAPRSDPAPAVTSPDLRNDFPAGQALPPEQPRGHLPPRGPPPPGPEAGQSPPCSVPPVSESGHGRYDADRVLMDSRTAPPPAAPARSARSPPPVCPT